jgi:hypothetical protein
MFQRVAAIAFIFACTSIAWAFLGATVFHRTYSSEKGLRGRVTSIWGGPHEQQPAYAFAKGTVLNLERTRVDVALSLDSRQKGLLWYNTYRVDFNGVYSFRNDLDTVEEVTFFFPLPAEKAVYDGLRLELDGRPLAIELDGKSATAKAAIAPHSTVVLRGSFRSQGLDRWRYNFGAAVSGIKDFEMRLATNFSKIDFSDDALAPTSKTRKDKGWELLWKYSSLVSGFNISVEMPSRLQPGQLAGEISYFAPVSLFFFFFLMLMISTLRGIDLHPMNYFFLAASFFAFHLLLAYLVDHVDIHIAFLICSAVSIGLVVSYLRIVVDSRFAWREAAISQFVYLVLFSYAFFLEGFTGLAVAIGSIITLFVVMQMTARVRWSEKFFSKPVAPDVLST